MRNLVKIGLTACLMLSLSGCDNTEEKTNQFLTKINSIDNELRESALASPDLKPNIKDLSKTIKINEKEYELDYTQQFLRVKNFNDSFYCNKTFNATTTDSNKTFALGSREVHTKCENNNMMIVYNKVGM